MRAGAAIAATGMFMGVAIMPKCLRLACARLDPEVSHQGALLP